MENILFYKAGQVDINILVQMRIEFLSEFWGPQPEQLVIALGNYLEKYFRKGISENTYICYLAKHNNEVAGIGGIILREQPGNFKNPSGKVGYLLNMYTVPAFRRKGICGKILEKLIEDARERGFNMFELHATNEGVPLYIKHGFILHPEPTYRKYYS